MIGQMEEKKYRSEAGVSQSQLQRLLLVSPKEFKEEVRTETAAMVTGTLAHAIALEGLTAFEDQYAIDDWPEVSGKKRSASKAYQDYKAELMKLVEEEKRTYIKAEDLQETLETVKAIDSAWGQGSPQPLLAVAGTPEVALWDIPIFEQIKGKGKIDWLPDDAPFIGDLKTTTTGLDDRSIKKKLLYEGWALQAAYYHDLFQIQTGESRMFAFMCVNKKTKQTRTIKVPSDSECMAYGREQYLKSIQIYAECMEKNEWSGYKTFDATNIFERS